MGKMQRDKGARFERAVADFLKPLFPGSRRGIGQTRSASECPDVDNTPFWVECKHGKKPNIRAAMEQAMKATDGRPVVAIVKDNGKEPLVTMNLNLFLILAMDHATALKAKNV